MTGRKFKLLLRRQLRRQQLQVEQLSIDAEASINRHFISRLGRLLYVWRFVVSWFLLIVLLIGGVIAQIYSLSDTYQHPAFIPGGTYTEGILGDFTTANPIYATGPVDSAVSQLVFSGLLTYNAQNQLIGNLASHWTVDSTGKIYTVYLRPNLVWQDGKPLTAADVVFTYQTIQNPDSQSPLTESFQGVTVKEVNPTTVTFTLVNPLSSFPYSLTTGILPRHILSNMPVSELRSATFNTLHPVGSGPFSWVSLAAQGGTPATHQEQINLKAFSNYALGAPKLQGFIVRAFHNQARLLKSFTRGSLNGMAGFSTMPNSLKSNHTLQTYSFPLTAENMVFFKTTSGVLQDTVVREALVKAVDMRKIILGLPYPVIPVDEPLLHNQLGYDPSYKQTTNQFTQAVQQLSQDGWVMGKNGIRYKDGQPLQFRLYALNTPINRYITQQLHQQWRTLGVNVKVILQGSANIQNTVTYHSYDALLYGISIGADPDVFVYWDSSQASATSPTKLNLSEYQSKTADQGLESARIVSNPTLRAIKYQTFLKAWQHDAPALGLFQPRFLYITDQFVGGLHEHTINEPSDIYNSVQNWEINQANVN